MSAKVYGYAKCNEEAEVLQNYAPDIDIIIEDVPDGGRYQMLRRFLRDGDTLMVVHLLTIGSCEAEVRAEIEYLQQQRIRLRFLDLPITLQEWDEKAAAIVYQTLQEVLLFYQRQRENMQILRSSRQQEGIRAARKAGRRFGRPAIGYSLEWEHVWEQWQAREISALEASRKLKMSRSTFYRLVKRYRQLQQQ